MIEIKKREMVLFLVILICMGEEVYAETFPEEVNNQDDLFEDDPPPNPDDFENLEPGSYNIINPFNQGMDLKYNNSGLEPQIPVKVDEVYEEEELVQEQIMEEEIMQYEKERLYINRAVGGNCHHRHSCSYLAAGACAGT